MASLLRTVAPADDGIRLDVFLANQPEVSSRTHAARLIAAGRVVVQGGRSRPGEFLAAGTEVAFVPETERAIDPLAPDLPLPEVPVLYEDAWLCAIDKPPGLAAHPPEDRVLVEHTVASWARARYGELPTAPDAPRPGIVHRLDRDTSGVMLVARNQGAFDFLRAQFRARTAVKVYHCLVFGEPRFQSDWIERPLGTDPRHKDRMAVVEEGGRESATFYEVLERFDGFAYVRCKPTTGRTHQIRVHLASIGHSLVGDRIYRSQKRQHDRLPAGAPEAKRQCLHALRLTVPHPETAVPITFEAPLAADLQRLLDWLRVARPLRR